MTKEQKEKFIDSLIDLKLNAEFDIAALLGFSNALSAYIAAVEDGRTCTGCVIENALGLRAVMNSGLNMSAHMTVFDSEQYLKKHFGVDTKKIEQSAAAQRALNNTKTVIDDCMKALGL